MPAYIGDELAIYYPSADDSADDQSGNGNDGTYGGGMGTVADTGESGVRAYSFDGSDDKITLPDLGLGTTYQFGFWIKPTSDFGTQNLIGFGHSTGAGLIWVYRLGRNIRVLVRDDSSVQMLATVSTAITNGVWNHIIAEREGGTVRIRVDDGTPATGSGSLGTCTIDTYIIGQSASGTAKFNGRLDDVRVTTDLWTSGERATVSADRAPPAAPPSATASTLTLLGVG